MPKRQLLPRTQITIDNVLESGYIEWGDIETKAPTLYDAVSPFRHIIVKLLTDINLKYGYWDRIPALEKPLSKCNETLSV
tara:strand:+ start:370 stop:609 length:240 start_codon:yes stop_codon:yes gene_type:complete